MRIKGCRSQCLVNASVMEDAFEKIQETGQEQRLARMAGLTSLDLTQFSMEAECCGRVTRIRQRGEG